MTGDILPRKLISYYAFHFSLSKSILYLSINYGASQLPSHKASYRIRRIFLEENIAKWQVGMVTRNQTKTEIQTFQSILCCQGSAKHTYSFKDFLTLSKQTEWCLFALQNYRCCKVEHFKIRYRWNKKERNINITLPPIVYFRVYINKSNLIRSNNKNRTSKIRFLYLW